MRITAINVEHKSNTKHNKVKGMPKNMQYEQTSSINYANSPQMGLISFGSARSVALKNLLLDVKKVCTTGKKYAMLDWERLTTKSSPKRLDEIAEKLAELSVLMNDQSKSPSLQASIDVLKSSGTTGLGDFNKKLIKDWTRALDHAKKLPSDFVESQSNLETRSNKAWEEARENNDFSHFEPFLAKMFIGTKKGAHFVEPNMAPLDVMLEDLGYNTQQINHMFEDLRVELVPLAKQIAAKAKINREILKQPANLEQMQAFALELSQDMGLDMSKILLGKTEHSFMSGLDSPKLIGMGISQSYGEQTTVADCLDLLGSFTHEGGHALVEQGASPKLHRTGLTGATMGIHESQSRLWENIVGKNKGFWQHYYPKLQQKVDGFQNISFADFYNTINYVEPSLIRTQADEVTYNLHVMLRHEIESDLLKPGRSDKEIAKLVHKLPETWGDKMEEYLGIRPKNDVEGVMQDCHWAGGLIGYFPSYTLGNLASAQIMNAAKKAIPDMDARIASGDLKTLQGWLKKNIYNDGQIYTPDEIMKRATGESLNSRHFIDYLKTKFLG